MSSAASDARIPHAWLYALPHGRMPATVTCGGVTYTHVETFKHDFFAATGLYRGPDGTLAVAKLGRVVPFLGVPVVAISRALAEREIRFYRLMAGTPGVPGLLGPIGRTGLLHEFVRGRPLGRNDAVGPDFFDQLMALLAAMHARHIAYVDLNKRQNILVGDDGRPYLIDFQISLHLPPDGPGGTWFGRWLLRRFQSADVYHALKHKRRLRRDLLTEPEATRLERISPWIRLHRAVARPLTHLRRAILARLGRSSEVPGSQAK